MYAYPQMILKKNIGNTDGFNTAVVDLDPLLIEVAQCEPLSNFCIRVMGDDGGDGIVNGKGVGTEMFTDILVT